MGRGMRQENKNMKNGATKRRGNCTTTVSETESSQDPQGRAECSVTSRDSWRFTKWRICEHSEI